MYREQYGEYAYWVLGVKDEKVINFGPISFQFPEYCLTNGHLMTIT